MKANTYGQSFWINLPVGGTTFLNILILFSALKQAIPTNETAKRSLHASYFLGMALLLGALTGFHVVLQNGGLYAMEFEHFY